MQTANIANIKEEKCDEISLNCTTNSALKLEVVKSEPNPYRHMVRIQ